MNQVVNETAVPLDVRIWLLGGFEQASAIRVPLSAIREPLPLSAIRVSPSAARVPLNTSCHFLPSIASDRH